MTSIDNLEHSRQSLKTRVEVAAALIFGQLFRRLPDGILKLKIKNTVFDRYIGWRNITLVADTDFGKKVKVRFPDSIQTTIFLTGVWEPNITTIIAQALLPGDVFIDVGANVGYYSLLAASRIGSEGHIYAIEASPRIFAALVENIGLNGITNVTTINRAVSNSTGLCEIFMAKETNLGHSSIVPGLARTDGHTLEAVVGCAPLGALVPSEHLLRARFIKIDIEGAERFSIEGVLDLLPRFSKETEWLVEMCPKFCPNGQPDVDWMFDVFIRAGYSAWVVENDYSEEFTFCEGHQATLTQITSAPKRDICDVIFSRTRRRGTT